MFSVKIHVLLFSEQRRATHMIYLLWSSSLFIRKIRRTSIDDDTAF